MAQPLIAGGLAFGVLKGYGLANDIDIPMSVYATHGAMMGASKVVVDMAVKDSVQRALGSGLLFAGLCYLVFKDENWALNGALGVGASYIADVVVPPEHKEEED